VEPDVLGELEHALPRGRSSADEVQRWRDLILDREPVPAGKQFLAVNAQVCNYLIIIEELPENLV